ncbi:MAG: aldehyde dehydrogenase family protein [Nitriliruptoraceae bacterium]|nr:aldehyde dehydrogenase family protein [Nitriliruptoraceae bacterium]
MSDRLDVRRTAKLYLGGKFPRSESGRTYEVEAADGRFLANAALASRKDVRDAVGAARKAQPGWAGATAYNRGQVLYRVAEMLEGRRVQFAHELVDAEGCKPKEAAAQVDAAIDRWVWYAGWSDKFHQVDGGLNPVAGPYFNLSVPEPTGVVGAIAPQGSSLLGLVAVLAPIIVSGNTVVVVTSRERPLPAVSLGEVLATSDVPGGVVNILTGDAEELAPILAGHLDVNALDLTGCAGTDTTELEVLAAENVKRVVRPPAEEPSFEPVPAGPRRILAFCETKTVWHPKGT